MKKLPNKDRANSIFANEVTWGRIKRQPCEVCGKPDAEGHHSDYSQPLKVMWLCKKHHAMWHSRNGFPKGEDRKFITLKVYKTDGKKLKVWAAQRGLKIYEVVNQLINK